MSKSEGTWITINGRHVLIKDGESATDAINRSIAEQNEKTKEDQIARNKKEANALNGKEEKSETFEGYDEDIDIQKNVMEFLEDFDGTDQQDAAIKKVSSLMRNSEFTAEDLVELWKKGTVQGDDLVIPFGDVENGMTGYDHVENVRITPKGTLEFKGGFRGWYDEDSIISLKEAEREIKLKKR